MFLIRRRVTYVVDTESLSNPALSVCLPVCWVF